MKVLSILLAIVILTLSGAWFYAQKLPQEVQQTQSARLQGDVSSIWSKLMDARAYPSWRNGMRAVMPVTDDSLGPVEWKEVYARSVLLARRTKVLVPDSMVIEFLPEERNFRTTWTWVLEPLPPDSVLVTLTSTRVLGAPLFRLSNKIFGSTDDLQQAALEDLKR